jgi:hypothetical protein
MGNFSPLNMFGYLTDTYRRVTRDLKPVEQELKKKWWSKAPDNVGSSLHEIQEDIARNRRDFQVRYLFVMLFD